ncbi:MAG: tRNA1(Val) (adenine(37)-N6)-methyltransferase [Clostridia bacterium]|nr:tRNA1(Val) (adenine(37)-N6)-methyltransferase [Clostridia bacterium]
METILKENERIDDLQLKGLKIIQNPDGFCFGIDAVLLSNFSQITKGGVVVDLGTGTGIIPLLVAGKSSARKIYGVEVQETVADMAQRSVLLNALSGRIEILNINLKDVHQHVEKGAADVVISNPPYMPAGGALVNPGSYKAISRHEVLCTLEDVVSSASTLLKEKGAFYMVHRPSRLVDIICLCRKYKLEPKQVRFVHPREGKEPNILLIKCVKSGNPELRIMPPLYVYGEGEAYTSEIYDIYAQVNIDVFDKRGND